MEKRLLIAFLFSFLFLFIWNKIVFIPRESVNPQGVENKYFVENKTKTEDLGEKEKKEYVKEKEVFKNEKKHILENEKIQVEFSNVNGVIERIFVKKYQTSLPVTDILKVGEENDIYWLKNVTDTSVTFFLEKNGQKIEKKFSLQPNEYIVLVEINILNGQKQEKVSFSLDNNSLDKKKLIGQDESLLEYSINYGSHFLRKSGASKFSKKEQKHEQKTIKWAGFRDKYFCFIFNPDFVISEYKIDILSEKNAQFFFTSELKKPEIMKFKIYFGPQEKEILSKYGLGFEQIMCFSNWGILNFAANIMYEILHFLYKIIHNWGISIILTAFLLYLAMYPLTLKSLVSMKKMQLLQPEIAKIKENNKNNPQKLQKETMELYKQYKINPLGGCLPIFIQMPFFIGIYQVLWRSVSFKGAEFLWIKDLSEPDKLIKIPVTLPMIGEYINILPLLMIVLMFLQQKISNKNMAVSDPMQASQQKMMLIVFPLMIGFIFYNIASGLSIYFTVFYLLSTLTQIKMSKIKI